MQTMNGLCRDSRHLSKLYDFMVQNKIYRLLMGGHLFGGELGIMAILVSLTWISVFQRVKRWLKHR